MFCSDNISISSKGNISFIQQYVANLKINDYILGYWNWDHFNNLGSHLHYYPCF